MSKGLFSSIRDLIIVTTSSIEQVVIGTTDAVVSVTDIARSKSASFQLESRQEFLQLVEELGGTSKVLKQQSDYDKLISQLHGRE